MTTFTLVGETRIPRLRIETWGTRPTNVPGAKARDFVRPVLSGLKPGPISGARTGKGEIQGSFATLRMTIFTHPSEAWMGHPPMAQSALFEDGGEEADQGAGFGEEGVVAVVGGHLAVVAAGAGGANDGGERADVLGRKEPVGGDAH